MHDVDGLIGRDGVAEPMAIVRLRVADEEDDVPAQCALLVEDVAAHLWMSREVRVEDLSERGARDVLGRTIDVTREMRCELDARHGRTILQRRLRVLASPLVSRRRYLAQRGCEDAVNLDGGPSTGVACRENGAIRVLAPARPVRHAVTFRRRGA